MSKTVTVVYAIADDAPASVQALAGRTINGKLECRNLGADYDNRIAINQAWAIAPDGFKPNRGGGFIQPKGGKGATGVSTQAAEAALLAFLRERGDWSDAHDAVRTKYPTMPLPAFSLEASKPTSDIGKAVRRMRDAMELADAESDTPTNTD